MGETRGSRVYLPSDIQEILEIGRDKTYAYLENVEKTGEPFVVHRIGKTLRIPKESFDRWFYGASGKQ